MRSLMYHRFSSSYVPDSRFVDPRVLDSQMKYIRDHHTIIEPGQHLEALTRRRPGPCPVAVTADDGYADFHEVAYPVFQKYSVPAMLFVATGYVSGTTWFWWDKLAFLMKTADPGEYQVEIGLKSPSLDLASESARKKSWHQVADKCRFLEDANKESLLIQLAQALHITLPAIPPAEYAPVTCTHIRNMGSNGIKFGAHTVHHPILSRVPAPVAREEITESKRQLESEIGHPVRWFAYPQGGPADYTDEIKAMVEEEFDASYLAFQDMESRGDLFRMPRYCVTDDMTSFRWVLCGAEFLGLRVRKLLGLPTGATEAYWAGSEDEGASHE